MRDHSLIIVVAAVVLFINLGAPRLWDRDEPRNAGCAVEMLAADDWVVPMFNAELRTHKPVLLYWFIMTAYGVFGVGEFAACFWSAFFGVGTVVMTYHIGRRLFGSRAGLWAGVILAEGPQQGQMITYLENVLDPEVSSAPYSNKVESFVQNNAKALEAWTGERPVTNGTVDHHKYVAKHARAIAEGLSRAHLVAGQPVEPDNRLNKALIKSYEYEAVLHARQQGVYDETVTQLKSSQRAMRK